MGLKTQSKLRLNPALARELLAILFARAQGVIEHRFKLPEKSMFSKFYPNVGAMLNSMSTWPVKAHHYFGVATRRNWRSGKKANVFQIVCCHADVDYGQTRHYKTREEALAAIKDFHPRPSAVVDTGNGFHCYWFFLAPLPAGDNLFQVEAINKGLGQALKGDSVGDASRILRVPGTFNIKDLAQPKPVKLVWCEPRRRYSLEDFADYAAATPREERPRMAPRLVQWRDVGGTPYGRAALANELARLAQAREGSHHRNIQLNRAAFALGRLVGGGHLGREVVELHLHQVGLNIGSSEREDLATLQSGLEAGIKEPRSV